MNIFINFNSSFSSWCSCSSSLMEFFWFIFIIATLASYFLLKSISRKKSKLPPGPVSIPILTSIQWLHKSFIDEFKPFLQHLLSKHGPILTLQICHGKAIFIASHELAHQALIQNGAIFADRPPPIPTSRCINFNISSVNYGLLWKILRRNLIYKIFNPSRIKSYAPARKWVFEILKNKLVKSQFESGDAPVVGIVDHFQFAMFSLLVLMCFGDKLDENEIKQVEHVQRPFLLNFRRFNILIFLPYRLGKILFKNRWRQLYELRNNQENVLVPLIRARQKKIQEYLTSDESVVAYVDTLLSLELPAEEGGGSRKLKEEEIVSLCSEFLSAGTDTTFTALQWIMTNLVKNPEIQSKLFDEIRGVMKEEDEEIKEEDLQKMPYLKAVILEGLRRHPPSHFVIPHAVTHDFSLNGYDIPKTAAVSFLVAEMGRDPEVWEDPMEFKPERFLMNGKEEVFDITGSKEIKMMPFGAGRRICPALGLALLHLEYFVANLVKDFEWVAEKGVAVDLSEKQEFTMEMKNPLKAHIILRR